MLQSKIIANKPLVQAPANDDDLIPGALLVDMVTPTYVLYQNSEIRTMVFVSDNTAMRPDLVAAMYYGYDEDTDLLMSYNDVGNPFAVDVGDLFIIPSISSLASGVVRPGGGEVTFDIGEQLKQLNAAKFNRKDSKRAEYAAKKKSQTAPKTAAVSENNLPPNFIDNGQQNVTRLQDSTVVFGESISNTSTINFKTTTQIRNELIKKNITNKI